MLGWRNLSRDQRVGGVFMLFILLAGFSLEVLSETAPLKMLISVGATLFALSVLINPASFKKRVGDLIEFRSMPVVCRWLMYIGLIFIVAGWGFGHIVGNFK